MISVAEQVVSCSLAPLNGKHDERPSPDTVPVFLTGQNNFVRSYECVPLEQVLRVVIGRMVCGAAQYVVVTPSTRNGPSPGARPAMGPFPDLITVFFK